MVLASAISGAQAAFCDVYLNEIRELIAGGPGQAASSSYRGVLQIKTADGTVAYSEDKDFEFDGTFSIDESATLSADADAYQFKTVYGELVPC